MALRVAVLMGGPSEEHDVSLKSGEGVCAALKARGITALPVIVPRSTIEHAAAAVRAELKQAGPDVVFLALHGRFGEDGTVQALCEALQVPYTGSDVAASRLGMDKVASRERFLAAGLRVPRWRTAEKAEARAGQGMAYPLVVKPSDQGSSIGVTMVVQPEDLPSAIQMARQYSGVVLIEEFVQGRELTVGVLGEEALPVVEIRPKHRFFDFSAKYTAGMTEYDVPAKLPAATASAVQAAGRAAHAALGCRHLSRTDLILTEAGVPVILEVNTIPGFTPTSLLPKAAACRGISYEEVCERLIRMAWESSPHAAAHAHGGAALIRPHG